MPQNDLFCFQKWKVAFYSFRIMKKSFYSMTFLIEIGDVKNDKSLFTAKRVILEESIITVTPPFVDILRGKSHFWAILNNFRCQYDTIDYFIVFYSKNVLTVTFSRWKRRSIEKCHNDDPPLLWPFYLLGTIFRHHYSLEKA